MKNLQTVYQQHNFIKEEKSIAFFIVKWKLVKLTVHGFAKKDHCIMAHTRFYKYRSKKWWKQCATLIQCRGLMFSCFENARRFFTLVLCYLGVYKAKFPQEKEQVDILSNQTSCFAFEQVGFSLLHFQRKLFRSKWNFCASLFSLSTIIFFVAFALFRINYWISVIRNWYFSTLIFISSKLYRR